MRFVVAGCDGAPIFQPTEGALDQVARLVSLGVEGWPDQASRIKEVTFGALSSDCCKRIRVLSAIYLAAAVSHWLKVRRLGFSLCAGAVVPS